MTCTRLSTKRFLSDKRKKAPIPSCATKGVLSPQSSIWSSNKIHPLRDNMDTGEHLPPAASTDDSTQQQFAEHQHDTSISKQDDILNFGCSCSAKERCRIMVQPCDVTASEEAMCDAEENNETISSNSGIANDSFIMDEDSKTG